MVCFNVYSRRVTVPARDEHLQQTYSRRVVCFQRLLATSDGSSSRRAPTAYLLATSDMLQSLLATSDGSSSRRALTAYLLATSGTVQRLLATSGDYSSRRAPTVYLLATSGMLPLLATSEENNAYSRRVAFTARDERLQRIYSRRVICLNVYSRRVTVAARSELLWYD